MYKDYLFFQENLISTKKKVKITREKHILFNNGTEYIDLHQIKKFRDFVCVLLKNKNYLLMPIDIDMGRIKFNDKLSIVLFECICYFLIKNYNCFLKIPFICDHNISTEYIIHSPLKMLNVQNGNHNKLFIKSFEWEIKVSHFRRLLKVSDNEDKMLASKVMQDVDSYLKFFNITEEYRTAISEVVAELADNALEHSNSDCIVDLDVTQDYVKKDGAIIREKDKYCGINIVVVNFSEIILGEQLKLKIEKEPDLPKRYKTVADSYVNHQKYMNKKYTDSDFFLISSFQDKVSGRIDSSSTGGRGLTKLIESLEKKSDTYNCYIISGNRILKFEHNFLNSSEDGWIGFNSQSNYIEYPPDESCLYESDFYFPGTAYNLNFILKREEHCDDN